MSVVREGTRDAMKIEYKPSYDTTGTLDLSAWTQTFSLVKESATDQQKYEFVRALAAFTEYAEAPYIVQVVSTSQMVVD